MGEAFGRLRKVTERVKKADKDAIIHQLRQENEALKKENQELRKIIEELNHRIKDLEEKLRLNSQNSSKPPSSDRYPKKPPPIGNKKERKSRPGFFRKWFPKEEVSEFIKTEVPPFFIHLFHNKLIMNNLYFFYQKM